MERMDEKESRQDLPPAAGVCAHIGFGADDAAAEVARDRLNTVLSTYRRLLTTEE